MKIRPVMGSYLSHLGTFTVTDALLRSQPQRACPVCCQHLARDRDMIVVKTRGSRFWVCKSNVEMGDKGCGLAFRVGTRKDYVARLVRERAQHLPGRHTATAQEEG